MIFIGMVYFVMLMFFKIHLAEHSNPDLFGIEKMLNKTILR